MKQIVILFLLAFSASVYAQDFAVQSFKALPLDLTARKEHRIVNNNGNIAALIRVKTNVEGFTFDRKGIVCIEQKHGEIFVWVLGHSRSLTIIHPTLGILKDYRYPVEIEEGMTYELVLTIQEVDNYYSTEPIDNNFENSRKVLVFDKEGNQYTTGLFISTANGSWIRIKTGRGNYEQYSLTESDKKDFTHMTIGKSEIEPLYIK